MRLLVVSDVIHHQSSGRLWAYGPYAREIDIWAELFSEVLIAAPCRNEAPGGVCLPFTRNNISIIPQMETGGDSLWAKAVQLLLLPWLVSGLIRAMRDAEAIHVRCPSNLGLLGIILAPHFSRYLVAKYAMDWSGYPGEPWTWRLQRWLLRSRYWSGPVTVYGGRPNQPPHVIPFFPALLTKKQLANARAVASNKKLGNALRILYVGRLTARKNVDALLSAIARLRDQGVPAQCVIVGEGPERFALEAQAADLGLIDCVKFAGGVPFEQVFGFYEHAEILALLSKAEGWPKVVTEGMAFGLICIGSDRGLMSTMLGEGRGVVVPPGDVEAITEAIRHIAVAPQEYESMRKLAAAWAQKYSLEGLREALRGLLTAQWGCPIDGPARSAEAPHSGVQT
jgi:glycosyltransferase involved in cell wall biosynthesis